MKNGKMALGVSMMVFAVLAAMLAVVPSTLAQPSYPANSAFLVPEHNSGAYCENSTIVQVRVNTSVPSVGGGLDIYFDQSCVNITAADFSGAPWTTVRGFTHNGNWVRMSCINFPGGTAVSGDNLFASITLHCINETNNCESYLNFSGVGIGDATGVGQLIDTDKGIGTAHNGTITCEAAPSSGETFDKHLYAGWNLISLPLIPEDNSTSAVLGGPITYDAVYRYNAITKRFESVMVSTMDPGIGYFVHVTTAGTWNYSGAPYNSMDISLKQGLNMVGWLNCTKAISDGEYNYVASWNATEQEFESYNPVAPMSFNDFDAMDRGNGYFISAKTETTLTKSCT